MDPLSLAASVISLSTIIVTLTWQLAGLKYGSLSRNYGTSVALIISICFPNIATQYERVERIILNGREEHVLALRQAVTDECNMTAIAGAIIAQVAITGLSLPSLSSTHWVARACLLFAVSSGCLTVYYCCVLQRTIGKLYQPRQIKGWLSLPPRTTQGPDVNRTWQPSLAAIFILSAPFNMMKASIFSLFVSLAIYQGFTWTRGLDTSAGHDDSRNVFITFIVGTGAVVLFFLLTFSSKAIENLLRIYRNIRKNSNAFLAAEEAQSREALADQLTHPRHSVERSLTMQGLSTALEAAAQAHLQCAEADRRVAIEYLRASEPGQKTEPQSTTPNINTDIV